MRSIYNTVTLQLQEVEDDGLVIDVLDPDGHVIERHVTNIGGNLTSNLGHIVKGIVRHDQVRQYPRIRHAPVPVPPPVETTHQPTREARRPPSHARGSIASAANR